MSPDEMLVALTVMIAVVPWAMSIHAKVALIAHAMEGMPEFVSKTQARLETHEQAIQALKTAAAARS